MWNFSTLNQVLQYPQGLENLKTQPLGDEPFLEALCFGCELEFQSVVVQFLAVKKASKQSACPK
jgi:hypothetical protein